jgi:FkbM family methyltransferase
MVSSSATLRCRGIAAITHLYPFLSGCGTFANSRLVDIAAAPPNQDVWSQVEGGDALVPMTDLVGRAMYFVGDLDRKVSHVIDRCVFPGDVALDIGANLGLVTLRLASRIGPTGRVHAFEPNPRLVGYLSRTLERNPTLPISLHPIALGSEDCSLELAIPADNLGAATLMREAGCQIASMVEVPVRRLSDYASRIGLDRVDFVKIDVEGFEHEVIKGAEDLFAKARPKVIILEEHAHPAHGKLAPSLEALSHLGYDIFGIRKTLLVLSLEIVTPQFSVPGCHDYVAIARKGTQAIRSRLRVG